MTSSDTSYWSQKISALLHDTPDKAADIISHEFRAERFQKLFGMESRNFNKCADFAAAAADRLSFPDHKKSGLKQDLSGIPAYPHPLGGSELKTTPFQSVSEAEEVSQKSMPYLLENDDPRAAFICAWRFWRNWASSCDQRFSHLPADTRIPDHTIWNHLFVTTAFQGSLPTDEQGNAIKEGKITPDNAPRLLLFSLGPVQPFIAAARSTRDLWSGSYLLAYLISKALGQIALDLGPDHVLFPNLLDQPLIDFRLKDEIYERHQFSKNTEKQNLWNSFDYLHRNISKLLTPSLPNRFMALLPAQLPNGQSADEYASHLVEDIQDELSDIADKVKSLIQEINPPATDSLDATRFHHQIENALEFQWQTIAIPQSAEELDEQLKILPESSGEEENPCKAFDAIRKMLENPQCKEQYSLRPESNWAGLNALIAMLHDGTKSSRVFKAWSDGEWKSGMNNLKDQLTGKEEAVLVISNQKNGEEIESFCKDNELPKNTFKPGEALGALTLVKRLWWHAWLGKEKIFGCSANDLRKRHPMPNTHAMALGQPFADSDEDEREAERATHDKYFAILALDGDEMGKWISGAKAPKMDHCLSPEAEKFYKTNAPDFLNAPRALTPSWHLQFSEALGNFSFHCAQRIVEAFDGRLIYAGGDDVLAMLPAKDALSCARALRAAFRGEMEELNKIKGIMTGSSKKQHSDRSTQLFNLKEDGYLRLHADSGSKHGVQAKLLSDPLDFPAIVPGPHADVSVGIAIAHFKSPLQDVVRAAQAAEKRAKRKPEDGGLGRGAVAITIFKRSGEILEWGSKWNSTGTELLENLLEDLKEKKLNKRFPHKLEAQLTPYLSQSTSVTADSDFEKVLFPAVLKKEVIHTLSRNDGGNLGKTELAQFAAYWQSLECNFDQNLQLLINLLRTAAWSANPEGKS